MKITFLENQNDELKTLANDAIYQFTVVFEREVARANASKEERQRLRAQKASAVEESIAPIVTETQTTTPEIDLPVQAPVSKPTGLRNFGLTLPLLQSNLLDAVQKKTLQIKPTGLQTTSDSNVSTTLNNTVTSSSSVTADINNANTTSSNPAKETENTEGGTRKSVDLPVENPKASFDRVVPKLSRSSSLLSQSSSSFERALSIASTGKRSIDSVTSVDTHAEKRQKEVHLDALNEDSEPKDAEEPKKGEGESEVKKSEPVKPSNSLLTLADIRKGLALKKKPNSAMSVLPVAQVVTDMTSQEKETTVVQTSVTPTSTNINESTDAQNSVVEEVPVSVVPEPSTTPVEEAPVQNIEPPQEEIEDGSVLLVEDKQPLQVEPESVPDIQTSNLEVSPTESDVSENKTSPDVPAVEHPPLPLEEPKDPVTSAEIPASEQEPQDVTVDTLDESQEILQDETQPSTMDHSLELEEGEVREESPTLDEPIVDSIAPSNIYKGAQTSFLTKDPKPIKSFLTGAAEKVKPQIKALEQAAMAAKKEQEERERKQKMKESKEERAKQVLERKKELEKQKIQAVQQKLEKRPAETNQEGQKKKPAVEVQIKSTANTFAKPVGKPKLPVPSKPQPKKPLGSSDSMLNSILPQPTQKPKLPTSQQTSIVDANGEIMGIDDSSSDSDDDSPKKKGPPVPSWAQSPNLREQLQQQQRTDPDKIFSDLISPNLKEIMGVNKRQSIHQMSLSAREIQQYKEKMGFE